MRKPLILFACLVFLASSCVKKPEPSIIIIPDKCKIGAGEEFPISLEGSNMPANGEITWTATKGEVNPSSGFNVIYTAPQEPGAVIITALLSAGDLEYSTTLVCEITATTPTVPTDTFTEILPGNSPDSDAITIAISEVMATPCNGVNGPNKNEYIELYNYGSNAIDVDGWWIATGPGGEGTPDKITFWDSINPGIGLGNNVITNSSIIPPRNFAIVISPRYYTPSNDLMPYIFPPKTIILTLSNNNYLGNDNRGLMGFSSPLSTLVLYIGSSSVMDKVVSTYGTPVYGSSPNNVADDNLDKFPYPLPNCHAMERIVASGPDLLGNWREISMGSPGEGDYLP